MIKTRSLKTGAFIALAGSAVLTGPALADCPVTLAIDDLKYCIVCEGAGRTYASCKAEAAAAVAVSGDQTGSPAGTADTKLLNAKATQE